MSNVFEGTRFCIHTFGCQMNKHDSERVAGMLEGLGSLPVETIEEADIVVFMTCCVREAADTISTHGLELAAVDLRQAITALGEITGDEVEERILDEVFSNFCVGK